ncbi:MAG: GCN5-related N-acetyltransferase [Actinomycetia bacterium]|nr:GCN5-related N-acetyltransferase [Actinomycetes bacterium]
MRIREVDASTAPDEELLRLHALEEACAPPGEPFRSPELSLGRYRHSSAEIRRDFFADEDGRLCGAGVLSVHGPAFAYVDLVVFPEHRRRGVGTALLEQLCAAARESGATSCFGHHWSEDGAAFASHVGAHEDQRDVRAMLDLRSAELAKPVVPAGWRLLSWIGAAPDELMESYTRARNAVDDAPIPDGVALPPLTVEGVRAVEATAAKRGREMRVTVALDELNEVAAFTDLRVTAGAPAASTDDTAVAGWARGRGLGRAVKLESLRRLRADRPEVETVTTMNAELNAAMRHINTRIGFVPTATLTTAVLTL